MELFQCNVIGIWIRFLNLQALIQCHDPTIICLQESHLRPSHALNLRDYMAQSYDITDGEKVSGGTTILVMYSTMVNICSPLQATACNVQYNG
jgi:exonuclease III